MKCDLTKSVGLAAVMATLISTQGVSANEQTVPQGHPIYNTHPAYGMPWHRYNPNSSSNYAMSGPYPMAHFVNSFHVFPNVGMPWVTGACPNCTTMKSSQPMYPAPVVNKTYEKYPVSGMPWYSPQTMKSKSPIGGPYPMSDYVNPLYPMSGMPWIAGMSRL